MAIYSANDPFYRVFANAAVATVGAIVVAVEYRTSVYGHVFPAGLNDCKSALDWVIANKESQRISRVIACGESGGANLSARARDTTSTVWMHIVLTFPVNTTQQSPRKRSNSHRCETHPQPPGLATMGLSRRVTGLPPFAITLNEADPLYDEGLAFYRKLRAAGVRTVGRMVLGTCHAGDFLSVLAAPDLYRATLYDLKAFVDGLL
eukprot:gene14853-17036_t